MSKMLLLADDSVTIQKVVELTFMDEDYEVVTVGDGDAALSSLEEVSPDVLIADVHMPGADGYTVCRRAKELRPDLAVLLLAGTFETFDEEEMRACGADGFLRKPFDSQDLLARVEKLVQARGAAEPQDPTPVEGEEPSAEVEVEEPAAGGDPEPPVIEPVEPSAETSEGGQEWGSLEETLEAEEPWAAAVAEDEEFELEREEPAAVERSFPSMDGPESQDAAAEVEPQDAATEAEAPTSSTALSDSDVDRIARRVVELLGQDVVREVAWEVVPDLAEIVVRDRLRELEEEVQQDT